MSPARYFAAPPVWDSGNLEQGRRDAMSAFIAERAAEGGKGYRAALADNIAAVRQLFALTNDLHSLGSGAALVENPRLIEVARYLGGPPVSADDFDTLAEEKIAKRRRLSGDLAKRAAEVVEAWIDRDRFPWLFEVPPRDPTGVEREVAIRWTAGLMTVQQVQTKRRSDSAKRQQEVVRQLLVNLGFIGVPARDINGLRDLGPGEFCEGESLVAGSKCDIPIGLRDGRLLFTECKVSNSATNSVKRLNREVGEKAGRWRGVFGEQAVTAAVLAGVYKLKNLQDAQGAGIVLFWEHDLGPMAEFLQGAT